MEIFFSSKSRLQNTSFSLCWMFLRKMFVGLLFLLFSNVAWSQHGSREGFISPLNIPLNLSGNFGEFRSNHFHTGIDIKTQGTTGLPVFACADGYVSRIKIKPYGYGNALYIDHPNGYTTVCGHLKGFNAQIDSFLVAAQYELESWEVDLYPGPDQLPVKQGDIVAYSGNSGSSGGPHVHFEIRETETEFPMNPLLWGFEVADTRAPLLKGIQITPLSDSSLVLGSQQKQMFSTRSATGKVALNRTSPIGVYGSFGIGVHTIDLLNNNSNVCGIYRLQIKMDGQVYYDQEIDQLDFAKLRFMNAHADYESLKKDRKSIHRGYRLPYNNLPIYKTITDDGSLVLYDDEEHLVEVSVWDVHGNISSVAFKVQQQKGSGERESELLPQGAKLFRYDQVNTIRTDSCNVYVPEGRLYEDCFAWVTEVRGGGLGLSQHYEIGNGYEPLHEPIQVKLKVRESIPESLLDKLLLLQYNNGRYYAKGGDVKRGWLSSRVNSFGVYCIGVDTIAPSIKVRNSAKSKLSFTITDDLSGIDRYEGRADGQWVRLHYDPKRARLWYESSDGVITPETRSFKLVVWDERGNQKEVEIDWE